MPISETLFTPTEAAVLTGLPLKAVHNAIDKKTVEVVAGMREGQPNRLLDLRGLMSLTLERRLCDRFAPALRRKVFDALADAPQRVVSLDDGFVKLDLREPRRTLALAVRDLRRARKAVVSDPDILGGEPVFQGTRIPVHLIAAQLAAGATSVELTESYPRLTPEMVRLAPIYAGAYPLRGRPRKQPWQNQEPTRRSRRPLATVQVA